MITSRLRHALQSIRQPVPRRTIEAATLPVGPAHAMLSIGNSLETAINGLHLRSARTSLLILDRRSTSAPSLEAVNAVAASLASEHRVVLGLPPGVVGRQVDSLTRIASRVGATTLDLGSTGWSRLVFGDRSQVLETADFPNELFDQYDIVVLSAPGDSGCVALWADYVHPNTALRSRVASNAVVELSSAIDAMYIIVGHLDGAYVVALAAPGIVADLIARAIEQFECRQRGLETSTPWEDAGVQHLFDVTSPDAGVTDLELSVILEDSYHEDIVRSLSEMLGWRYSIHHQGEY